MTDNEKIAALAAAVDGMKAERNWYRTAWSEATTQRDDLRIRLDSLKQSEDATSAALAEALARNVTLEQIKESQNRYIAMYREQLAGAGEERRFLEESVQSFSVDETNWNRERDKLETELEHANNSLSVLREDNIELSNELSQARNRIFSLEYSRNKAQRQLEELREWAAVTQEDLRLVREQRDDLIAWWRDANGYVEEAGM